MASGGPQQGADARASKAQANTVVGISRRKHKDEKTIRPILNTMIAAPC